MAPPGPLNHPSHTHTLRLSSLDPATQKLGQLQFTQMIEEQSRDLSPKNFAALVFDLKQDGLELMLSDMPASSPNYKQHTLIGLNVMDCLLSIKDENSIRRRRDFGNQLREVIKNGM